MALMLIAMTQERRCGYTNYRNEIGEEISCGIVGIPKIHRDDLIFTVLGGSLTAVNTGTGKEVWVNRDCEEHPQMFGVDAEGISHVFGIDSIVKVGRNGQTMTKTSVAGAGNLGLTGHWTEPFFIGSQIVCADMFARQFLSFNSSGQIARLGQAIASIPKQNVPIYTGTSLLFVDVDNNVYKCNIEK